MKLRFKHQQFQADAARAVCDVFRGQPRLVPTYRIDSGEGADGRILLDEEARFTGWNNHPLVPDMTDDVVLDNLRAVQRAGNLPLSERLEGRYNLTIEMETGTGKTYTYIKTMHELHRAYGWSKFIIVTPSVAIREGVHKTFQVTQEHFALEYGTKIRFFIYDSRNLTDIDRFAADPHINAMIINAQAFNARGRDARRIRMRLDEFRSRRPIDILAGTNPVLIIDEPQSVEGRATREALKKFNPLVTLRYSATHRQDSLYNMVYRLDAQDAYNRKLVKKIRVKGITASGSTGTDGYVFLVSVNTFENRNPTATIEFETRTKNGIRRTRRTASEGFDLFEQSGKMDEYKDRWRVSRIDGRDGIIEFVNGVRLASGEVRGARNEDHIRRIQIRETIRSHMEQEMALRRKNIKVLSLFFIDEVAKYRRYEDGRAVNGVYADMFEKEYASLMDELESRQEYQEGERLEYLNFLRRDNVGRIHAGYFSVDRRSGQEKDSETRRGSTESDDVDAYDLIMRDRERLLDMGEPVRFIFSHSALREGWDNPNVFQICTLKQSDATVRKRQEVGRGLRLCVNQDGVRMDGEQLAGEDVHGVNILTVIASESYDRFSRALQAELAEAVADRPTRITPALFQDRTVTTPDGGTVRIDEDAAIGLQKDLIDKGYVRNGALTEAWHEARKDGTFRLSEENAPYAEAVAVILDGVLDPGRMVENALAGTARVEIDRKKLESAAFQELWRRINRKSAYVVDFDPEELKRKAIEALDTHLAVRDIHVDVTTGAMDGISGREALRQGTAFTIRTAETRHVPAEASSGTRFDLIGRIVAETGLTRRDAADILAGMHPDAFAQFRKNPEDFILKASRLINEQKAGIIVEHIAYNRLEETYDTDIFTDPSLLREAPSARVMETGKHLYSCLVYDSDGEKRFAKELEEHEDVVIYVKLPRGFSISTPVGGYNPDWAITFTGDRVKHIYFVAETKGSLETLQLRRIEDAKIACARRHFQAISSDEVVYDVVDSYAALHDKVMK